MSFTDNFDRADAPNLGPNWSPLVATSRLAIMSNSAGVFYPDGNACADAWLASVPPNQFSQATIKIFVTERMGGALVRAQTPGGMYIHGYFGGYVGTRYVIGKFVEYTGYIQLGTSSKAPKTGDVVKLEAVGTLLNLYVNGIKILHATDSDFPAGQPGLYLAYSYGISGPGWDNWSGGQV